MEPITQLEQPAAFCCAPLAARALSDREAGATAELFKALGDANRVRIVNLLANSAGPVCVCDINAHFDLAQPTISHHLKKLTAAGVLQREQRGTWAYFSINDEIFSKLSEAFRTKEEVQ